MGATAWSPVVVVGAGPVGLAAAAHLLERVLEILVLEADESVGTAVQEREAVLAVEVRHRRRPRSSLPASAPESAQPRCRARESTPCPPWGVRRARAVVDASGTRGRPEPLGHSGLSASGETEATDHVTGRLPDVLGSDRSAAGALRGRGGRRPRRQPSRGTRRRNTAGLPSRFALLS
ncbi:NAD(P)-binding protein [Streptomyces xiaopingdaonensis]|uniref:NAD(P)-binding protein n=1 Tax=Streptomyces xiaopingdaonensis TaxID=1565415 RepID=UPI001ED96A39|nr:NAD(P)-binding protein [Streptomyces xiaopingdaonensis]